MGRARILECMIENAKVEEEIGEGADPGSHARRALEFSQEAIELAKHTQHHLLLANAHLWQGLTQCNSFFDNPEAARESYDLARASCGANQPDNKIWQDLQTLSAKILRKGSVHPALKAWSQGAVGEKTFRQISEEFAEIVIAQVWEREACFVAAPNMDYQAQKLIVGFPVDPDPCASFAPLTARDLLPLATPAPRAQAPGKG